MGYRLIYHPDVKNVDLPKVDKRRRAIIKRAIEERLSEHPELYGKPLQRTLKRYWKLRVGHYRVVFKISGRDVLILGIIHRRDVYQQIIKRTD